VSLNHGGLGLPEIRSRRTAVRDYKVIKDKNPHPYERWFALERLLKKKPPGFALWNVMTIPVIWPDQ
tara:strand:+ start:958 stop:1158 length:201 start_codon:yes stop_codon:yes gene_type:complete